MQLQKLYHNDEWSKNVLKRQVSLRKKFMIDPQLITTSNSLEGYKITKHLGLVRGITVRSRSLLGNIGGGFQSLFGGKLSIYVELCETTREEAYQLMVQHGNQMGANAIINMRYDANDVMQGITEVLAYGTAVVVEKQF
ncbi:YbjQ family protein [soil metagenome]